MHFALVWKGEGIAEYDNKTLILFIDGVEVASAKEQFVRTFKAYADSSFVPHTVKVNEMNTLMPWLWYSGMTEPGI